MYILWADLLVKSKLYKEINFEYNPEQYDTCEVLNLVLKRYPTIFFAKELDVVKNMCSEPTDIFIKAEHELWSDYLIFRKKATEVFRKGNSDEAEIISFYPQKEITIKWKRWGEETFVYDERKNRYVQKKE